MYEIKVMRDKKQIRLIVRETLNEIAMAIGGGGWDSNNDITHFHGYPSGYSQFPFLYTDTPEMLPKAEEINKNNEYKINQNASKNQEVYDFPFDYFKKGFEIEKETNDYLNVYDIAKKVIENLQKDKNYYAK